MILSLLMFAAGLSCTSRTQGLLSRETKSMQKSGSSWNATYTSFALTSKGGSAKHTGSHSPPPSSLSAPHSCCLLAPTWTGRSFLNSPASQLKTFEASQQLYDAEKSLRIEAQKKAAAAAIRAGYQADRQALMEERKAQAAVLTGASTTPHRPASPPRPRQH